MYYMVCDKGHKCAILFINMEINDFGPDRILHDNESMKLENGRKESHHDSDETMNSEMMYCE